MLCLLTGYLHALTHLLKFLNLALLRHDLLSGTLQLDVSILNLGPVVVATEVAYLLSELLEVVLPLHHLQLLPLLLLVILMVLTLIKARMRGERQCRYLH